MLSVKDIIDALSAADLDRVDLAQIKVFRSLPDMIFRQMPLIILIGNQIFNWNLLEVNIGHIRISFHVNAPPPAHAA